MKIIISLITTVFFFSITNSQIYKTNLSRYDFLTNPDSFKIENLNLEVNQLPDGFTKVILLDDDIEKGHFLIKPLDFVKFEAKFKNLIRSLGYSKILLNKSQNAILTLYSDITSYYFSINERPQVATIYLKDESAYADVFANLNNLQESNDNKTAYVGNLDEVRIDISFYSGFIEKIEVKGLVNGIYVTFANKYSIGVSSLKNIRNFENIRLFSNYKYSVEYESEIITKKGNKNQNKRGSSNVGLNRINRLTKESVYENDNIKYKVSGIRKQSHLDSGKSVNLMVYLNDLIRYERIIDINANDISPDKQKIHLGPDEKSAKLYREESTKILEAVVFNDLLGLLDEDNPNGIIQTEISKRFNINTNRRDVSPGKKWFSPIMPPFLISEGWGSFEYMDAKILLSKIEDDNKFLIPSYDDQKLRLLGLYQRRNFSVGGNLNVLAFENQNLKFNMFFDTGFEFSTSAFKLSEDSTESENLNFMEYNISLKYHLFPEKRYGILVSDKLSYFETLNDDEPTLSIDETSYWLNTIEFMAYLDISTSSKVFARYRLIHQVADIDKNFSQLQLGVNFFVLEKNRKD